MKLRDLALIVGILGLILTWFWCLRGSSAVPAGPAAIVSEPEPAIPAPAPQGERAAAPSTPQPPAAANLGLSYADNGKVLLEGAVNSEAEKVRLLGAARKQYGAERVIDALSVDATLGDVGSVTLTGNAATEAAKQTAAASAKQVFGASATIDNQITVLAAPAPAAAAPEVPAQQRKLSEAMLGKTVEFETGSAKLTPRGMTVLDGLVPIMQADTNTHIEVQGHTDDRGMAAANLALSQRRASAALDYLVSRGVAAQRLSARGFGQEQPIADNATSEGRRQNRRIDFRVEERN